MKVIIIVVYQKGFSTRLRPYSSGAYMSEHQSSRGIAKTTYSRKAGMDSVLSWKIIIWLTGGGILEDHSEDL
jgi:hypothetical protein